ncbi:MAG: MATE family efflux transporter [Burkholderiaceae bacterium]|nr:MATE family efflux transporter [Burkholderiaceae bacterium]
MDPAIARAPPHRPRQEHAGLPAHAARRQPVTELRDILRHGGAVLVGQLAVTAYGVVDTVIAGRHSNEALAALSVGSAVFISVFVALMGVLQALLPVWAELHGAGRQAEVGRSLRQALYLCAITIVIGMAALLHPDPLLRLTGVPEAMQEEVRGYLRVLAWTVPAALLFRMYATLNQSLGKPLLVTWLQIGSLAVKVPLSIWFAFGGLGLPASGAVGCAWASLVVNYLMLFTAFWLLRTEPFYRPYGLWRPMERPHGPTLARYARLGVPGGLAILVEVTSFTLMALFIARLGTVASAAHQVAANVAAVLYMVPLSLGIATSARVGYWLGAGDPHRARRVLVTGFKVTLGAAVVLASLLLLSRHGLANLYAANTQVAALAGALLAWVAIYHVADATQALSVFVLRCYRVAIAPLMVYCVLLWGVGLGGGYLLAYEGIAGRPPLQAPQAFWMTGGAALSLTAIIFVLLVRHRSAPGRNGATATN